ncbi:hypothetical protein FIBSPDRAFT_1004447 [Athelia psychrophila]|uniref:C2 domain-containing protein n=1 Tax=Athelia psychrophila TaxID=1759441 RepID=A0A166PWH0_9AGAM|nr:hypothetical protein FIBSPDRAFT_1004447 [Fibularhizoctonia sp. CBS 109695]
MFVFKGAVNHTLNFAGGVAKWIREMIKALSRYVRRNTRAEAIPQMELGEGPPEGVEIGLPPQDSNAGSPVASLEQPEQPVTENLVSAPTAVDSDEYSNFLLFVGTAEWTRDAGAREDNEDLFVEVKVDGAREVLRTMHRKTAHWNEDVKMIEIRSVAQNSSESCLLRVQEISFESLLEFCADGDVAALELTIAPLVSATIDQATAVDVLKGSKHSATDSIGFITVKLCRLPHDSPNLLEPLVDRMIADEVDEGGQIDNDRHLNLLAG